MHAIKANRVVQVVKRDALGELLRFDPAFVAEAKADSFWQMPGTSGRAGRLTAIRS